MKWWIGFDNTRREVFHREIDLNKSGFRLSPRALIKIVFGLIVFLLSAGVAFYFKQFPQMWMAIIFGVFLTVLQLLFYGYESNPEDEAASNVPNS